MQVCTIGIAMVRGTTRGIEYWDGELDRYAGLHREGDRDCDGAGDRSYWLDRAGGPGSSPGKKIFHKHKTTLLVERTSRI
ncbi:hypothetical protein ASZ90_016423 [hydrocarbon metagenome]|uniref:Uncharacterized protein n=1 Tax=hydrocarbon metagenome TaxID=938273 RepID=A0A0W8EWQ4_9ZZZZ